MLSAYTIMAHKASSKGQDIYMNESGTCIDDLEAENDERNDRDIYGCNLSEPQEASMSSKPFATKDLPRKSLIARSETTPSTESLSGGSSTATSAAPTPAIACGERSLSSNKRTSRVSGSRGRSGDDENHKDEDEDDGRNRKRARPNPPEPLTTPKVPRLPCPYYKHDPGMFRTSEVCRGSWPDIAKLK